MMTLNDILDRWDYEALAKRYRAFNKFEVEREERRAKGEIVIEDEGDYEPSTKKTIRQGENQY